VSAYLHAAAMVKAGVYLVARMTPGFADSPPWRPMVLTLGMLTVLLAGWRAVREYDLKLILAFGTVSQLGLITVMVGAGGSDLMLAGLALLCAHAMFKAALFMVVGIIDHATGTRDIRRLAWLGQRSRPLLVIAIGATASMAALPPFLGFVAKEADFETLLHSQSLGSAASFVLAGIAFGSVFTTIYSLRFLWGAFAKKGRSEPSKRVAALHEPSATFLAAPAILAVAGLLFGLWPAPLDRALGSYADTVPGGVHYKLALWHGLGVPLLLSAVVLAVGTAAFFGRARLRRARLGYLPLGNADRIYDAAIRGLDVLSVRLTGITQRGSIPATQSGILATLAVVPAVVLALGARDRPEFGLWDSPLQLVVGVLILAAAIGATVMRNRLAAVLLVGVTGYGCGAIFAFHGAPDLALTQFLVETVTLVVFVLVLRTLPAESDRANIRKHRLPRAALAIAVGASVTTLAVFAMAARTGDADRRTAPRRRVLPRPWRQRRQCASRRHPGMGHARRDLGAAGRRHGCGVDGVPPSAFWRGAACRRRRLARHSCESRNRNQPRCGRHHLAARERASRSATPLPGARGRDPDDLPAHHGAVGLLLLRGPQRARGRLRGRPDGGPGARAAVSRGRTLRTR
jgi:multicomponent Na+:H+ antiporter subunit A